jgi:AraC family transcriptional regulator
MSGAGEMAGRREFNPMQSGWAVERRPVSAFVLSESVCATAMDVPAHSHGEPHVTMILEGVCRERYLGRLRELAPRSLIYTAPGEAHAIRLDEARFRTFDLELSNAWMARWLERPIEPAALCDAQPGSIVRLATRLYQEFRLTDDLSPLAIEGLALEIVAELAREARRTGALNEPAWLRSVVERIQEEFARPISLAELAATAGVHPAHLVEVFRRYRRCTPGDFIRQTRINAAIRQMADRKHSLVDIALSTGFSDQSHFSRVFKRLTGMSPAQYRDLHFIPSTRKSYKTEPAPSSIEWKPSRPSS